jgi:hypothetical protein
LGTRAKHPFGECVVELAHPYLKQLSIKTGETVDLALFRRDHMVFVDQIAGSHRLRAAFKVFTGAIYAISIPTPQSRFLQSKTRFAKPLLFET